MLLVTQCDLSNFQWISCRSIKFNESSICTQWVAWLCASSELHFSPNLIILQLLYIVILTVALLVLVTVNISVDRPLLAMLLNAWRLLNNIGFLFCPLMTWNAMQGTGNSIYTLVKNSLDYRYVAVIVQLFTALELFLCFFPPLITF